MALYATKNEEQARQMASRISPYWPLLEKKR